eukprot:scaffold167427_cov18-Tisochrysis_lutea.AAC.1
MESAAEELEVQKLGLSRERGECYFPASLHASISTNAIYLVLPIESRKPKSHDFIIILRIAAAQYDVAATLHRKVTEFHQRFASLGDAQQALSMQLRQGVPHCLCGFSILFFFLNGNGYKTEERKL